MWLFQCLHDNAIFVLFPTAKLPQVCDFMIILYQWYFVVQELIHAVLSDDLLKLEDCLSTHKSISVNARFLVD